MGRPTVNIGKCKVEGCNNEIKAKQLCSKHWKRLTNHGDVDTILPRGGSNALYADSSKCSIEVCESKPQANNLCQKHYMNFRYHRDKGRVKSVRDYIDMKNKA